MIRVGTVTRDRDMASGDVGRTPSIMGIPIKTYPQRDS